MDLKPTDQETYCRTFLGRFFLRLHNDVTYHGADNLTEHAYYRVHMFIKFQGKESQTCIKSCELIRFLPVISIMKQRNTLQTYSSTDHPLTFIDYYIIKHVDSHNGRLSLGYCKLC